MKILKPVLIIAVFLISYLVTAQDPHAESGLTKGIVQEVLQVSSYTYLNVLDKEGTKRWIAVPTIDAKLGEIYYYKGGMEMPDFESKELDRKFDTVLFLSSITNAEAIDPDSGLVDPNAIVEKDAKPVKKATLEKLALSIEGIEGGIRIADLFENKDLYAGKTIKIKGEVTKFTSAIMSKNWVHFQDGTEFNGAYDLMITTQENVNVGDVIIFEGMITLDKDFGAGYFYNIIMEEAVLIK